MKIKISSNLFNVVGTTFCFVSYFDSWLLGFGIGLALSAIVGAIESLKED